jgi:type VI secretion system secreted protein VgrG
MANQRYRAKLEDGQVIEGKTDAEGLTEVLKSSIPFGRYTIEALFD